MQDASNALLLVTVTIDAVTVDCQWRAKMLRRVISPIAEACLIERPARLL
jgi:hypothetical protein